MLSRFQGTTGIEDDLLARFARDVEEKLNEGEWYWGDVPVESPVSTTPSLPVPEEIPPQSEPGPEGFPEEGEGEVVGAPTEAVDPNQKIVGLATETRNINVNGAAWWHAEVPTAILKVALFTFRKTEGSDAENHLEARLRNWTEELWVGDLFSSQEFEFEPRLKIFDLDDFEVDPDAVIGGACVRLNNGGAVWVPKSVRMGFQFVRL